MDQIKLEVTQIKNCEKSSIKQYDISVILNKVALGHVIFNGEEVIPASKIDAIEFDLFTCDCGVPGCAGFHTSIIQKKTENTVKWIFPTDKSYSVSKLEYEFDRRQFEEEFNTLKYKMVELEKRNTHLITCIRDLSQYSDGENLEGDKRFEVSSIAESFKWYDNRHKTKQKFDELLKEIAPHLADKKLSFQYEGKISENFDFEYVICRMLNEWPRNDRQRYFKNVRAAAKAIDAFIVNNDNSQFAKIMSDSYKDFVDAKESKDYFAETVWNGLDILVDKLVTEEEFKLDKLSIVVAVE